MKRLFSCLLVLFLITQSWAMDFKGSYYIGTSGTKPGGGNPEFPTLRAAFDSLSASNATFSGNCVFYITSNLDETSTTSGLGLACDPSSYTVTFKPYTGVSPVITIAYTADVNSGPSGQFVIGIPTKNNIAWADCKPTRNIIFDGSNTEGGTTRDMTIQSATTNHRNSMDILIVGDVQNLTIKNCNIYYKNQVVSTSGNLFISALSIRSATAANTGATEKIPSNITIQNNHISANFAGVPQSLQGIGFYAPATVPVVYPSNITISGNKIEGKRRAIALYVAGSTDIHGNEIILNQDIKDGLTNEAIYGVTTLAGSVFNICDNKITGISSINSTGVAYGIAGINIESNGTWNIYNNMITGFALAAAAADKSSYVYGIRNASATATANIYNNTILMNDLASIGAGTVNYRGIFISDGIDTVKNNIIVNEENDFASCNIYRSGTAGTFSSDYNDFYATGTTAQIGYWNAASAADLTAWKTASAQDAHSVSKAVVFTSPSDLHLSGTSIGDHTLTGTPISIITTDIDGDVRNAAFPYMGADENTTAPLPVELASFSASYKGNAAELKWTTATEINNAYFDIERKYAGKSWEKIGQVRGNGTTSEKSQYIYTDKTLTEAASYRLKQVDLSGSYTYYGIVEITSVEVTSVPEEFQLSQNYPNPFNPSTVIKYSLPLDAKVKLSVYSITGQLVAELVDAQQNAGNHSAVFNASGLASGTYIYKIQAGSFVQTRKMLLLK